MKGESDMSTWRLWHSVMRMGFPESGPLWRITPDVYESKEECQMALSMASRRFSEDLKENRTVIEIMTVTDPSAPRNVVAYVMKDATHPSGKRDVVAQWACYPAGFNAND